MSCHIISTTVDIPNPTRGVLVSACLGLHCHAGHVSITLFPTLKLSLLWDCFVAEIVVRLSRRCSGFVLAFMADGSYSLYVGKSGRGKGGGKGTGDEIDGGS